MMQTFADDTATVKIKTLKVLTDQWYSPILCKYMIYNVRYEHIHWVWFP